MQQFPIELFMKHFLDICECGYARSIPFVSYTLWNKGDEHRKHRTASYCITPYSIAPHRTASHCIAPYSIAQHRTKQPSSKSLRIIHNTV